MKVWAGRYSPQTHSPHRLRSSAGHSGGASYRTVASTEERTWRCSQYWWKHRVRMLTHKYQLAICRGKLQHTVTLDLSKHVVHSPTFGFNGRLYSGGISVGIEVQGRHHGGEGGFMGLRIQNKWLESPQIHSNPHRSWLSCIQRITPTLRVSCPRNSDTIAILRDLHQRQSCQHLPIQ